MTQLKPLQTEETSKLNAKLVLNATWAAVLLIAAGLALFGYAISIVTFTDWEDYLLVGFPLVFAGASFASIFIMRRGRLALASGNIFSLNLIIPLLIAFIIRDTLWAALAYAFVSSALLIWRAMPRSSWRWAIIAASATLIVVVVVNLIDPAGRFLPPAGFDIFITILLTVFFGAFLAQVAREAWNRNTIRSRFLTLSLVLTLLAAVVIAVVSVNSLFTAGEQAQETSSIVLRSQIEDTLRNQTDEIALRNDQILRKISQDAQDLAQQAASIFENSSAFNTASFWVAEEHMFFGPEDQYINLDSDISTVFVPNTVVVNNRINEQLELMAFLDIAFVPVFESDPNTVAIYFISKDDITWFYPNISLGQFVPPDFRATEDIFYSIGSPENNPQRNVVWTPVYDDPAGQGLLVSTIAPVYANNRFMGVIGIDVSLANLTANIENENFSGESGAYAFLVNDDGRALALPEQGYRDLLGRERQPGEFGVDLAATAQTGFLPLFEDMLTGEYGFESVVIEDQEFYVAYSPLITTDWHIASLASAEKVLAPAVELRTELQELSNSLVFGRILPVGLLFLGLVVIGSLFFTNRLIDPIEQLTEGAEKIGLGNWDAPLPESELKEIDGLSVTLRTMASQLRSTLGSLEQRVADRTRNLELAAEVGRAVSQVRDLDAMLTDACGLILKEFDLYYVQVYLMDPSGSTLKLEAGTGTVGAQLLERGHKLELNTNSINGRAATEKRSVVIADTSKSETFRQNPLLPETLGEMAVPLIVNERVVGVLDMQSSKPDILTDEVLSAFEALAGQFAVAIQNANLLAEVEQSRIEVEKQAASLVRTNWQSYMDAIHKPESTGYVFDGAEIKSLTGDEDDQISSDNETIAAPIEVLGEQLGSLAIEMKEGDQTPDNMELINVVARQVAQQIESLRLIDNAERYRHEVEEAATRSTLDGWKKYIESRPENIMGYVYDTREVRVLDRLPDNNAVTLPIKVGDGTVGKIAVQDFEEHDDQSLDIAKAVLERLAAHIENLRLLDETKQSQIELDKRAAELQSVAEIATQSSQATTIDEMLQTVADLTKSSYDLYHAHIYLLDDDKTTLTLAAGAGETGRQMVTEKLTIDFDHPHSLVARAARSGQGVISNDVTKETDFLPHPLLPDTKAEMAIPIKLGDRVLGVLDVQADRINRFTEEDVAIKTTLAQQVGASLDNMRQYQMSQKIARELGVVANVSTATATITDATSLLTEVVDQTKAAFDLYHVHIYLTNSTGDTLELAAGAGEVGRTMVAEGRQIPVSSEKSLVARAARTRTGAVVNNVRSDPDFLPNPLLPDTRAELAVPMIVGDKVIGVLDVQSEQLNRFTDIDVNIKTTLAAQVAVALQNARTFTQAQSQAQREAMLNTISQKIQSATTVESVLQIAARELGRALNAPLTVAQLGLDTKGNGFEKVKANGN